MASGDRSGSKSQRAQLVLDSALDELGYARSSCGMECQRCGLSNAEAARFCPGCGAALDATPGSLLPGSMLPGGEFTTERPGPGGTLASVSYTAQQSAGTARAA